MSTASHVPATAKSVPPLALAEALLFATPMTSVLSALVNSSAAWAEAAARAGPFWEPSSGKLNTALNLSFGVPKSVKASIRFDPNREFSVAFFDPNGVSESTKDIMAIPRRVRITSTFPADTLTALIKHMPNLTALHVTRYTQLEDSFKALAWAKNLTEVTVAIVGKHATDLSAFSSLKSLQSLDLGRTARVNDLSALAPLRGLKQLTLRDAQGLEDISALGEHQELEELTLTGCMSLLDFSALESCGKLHTLTLLAVWETKYEERIGDVDFTFLARIKALKKARVANVCGSEASEVVRVLEGRGMSVTKWDNGVYGAESGDPNPAWAQRHSNIDDKGESDHEYGPDRSTMDLAGLPQEVQRVLANPKLPLIIDLLRKKDSTAILIPALTVIGAIAHDPNQTQLVVDMGSLSILHKLLKHPHPAIQSGVLFAVHNVLHGSRDRLKAIIEEGMWPTILHAAETADTTVRHRCLWILKHALHLATIAQSKYFVDVGAIACLCSFIDGDNKYVELAAVDVIHRLMLRHPAEQANLVFHDGSDEYFQQKNRPPPGRNTYPDKVIECGGLVKIDGCRHDTDSNLDWEIRALFHEQFDE